MSIKLENEADKLGYALAMNIASSVMQLPLEFNRDIFAEAVTELVKGSQPVMNPGEYQKIMQDFHKKLQELGQAELNEIASQNIEEEKKFFEENKLRQGVKTTASGLQYEILEEGKGDGPKAGCKVRVHYEGSLLNGNVFDSSIKRGQPAEFGLEQVIPGWTEALKLMKKGGKHRLFIPASLAYGDKGVRDVIPPNSMLKFDVELLEIL